MRRWAVARLCAAAVLVSISACGVQGLSFVRDERVEIVKPDDREKVRLPFDVVWTATDFDTRSSRGGDGGSFAVFVDRSPQPPRETLSWFARDDEFCDDTPGCPDETYFETKNIYATDVTHVTIDRLPDNRAERARRYRDLHQVVVILLDDEGRRIGESAFGIDFELDRDDT